MFRVAKPEGWGSMPLNKKIAYYGTQLTPAYAPYVDKIEAKRIVKELAGDAIRVAPIIRILDGPLDLSQNDLNSLHIIKSAHGSAWNIDITPTTNFYRSAIQLMMWNRVYAPNKELQYATISPRFFIEEKVDDYEMGVTGNATTFLVRCIHGNPVSFHVKKGKRYNAYRVSNWSPLKTEIPDCVIPEEKEQMLDLARLLSSPFEFVRVDFYLSRDRKLYFSEFTFTPNAGKQFYTPEMELELGALWN